MEGAARMIAVPDASPEERWIQALWTGGTNLALLPAIVLTGQLDMYFESVVCSFALFTSSMYHVCQSLRCRCLGFNSGRWHHMDNVFAITGLLVSIVNFSQVPRPSSWRELRNTLVVSIVICAQISSPWDLMHSIGPLAVGVVLMFFEMIYLRRLPTLCKADLVKAALCACGGGLCFYKGLDQFEDWLRLWHGGWHIFVGAMLYYCVRAQNPRTRVAAKDA
ncbi:unnamed protein product [Effrenium voratum]|nr:unnamed protein product [Effrenium voratum]